MTDLKDLNDFETMLVRVVGHEGRMMSFSKSGYSETHPTNICVFNGRIAVTEGDQLRTIWWGDIDLTLWEQRFAVLARLLGREISIFHEADAPDVNRRSIRMGPVAVFSSRGETTIGERHQYLVRADDGTLRRHIPPDRSKRWRWRVLRHRPRLWRFWTVNKKRHESPPYDVRSTLFYIGVRDSGRSPGLVLVAAGSERLGSSTRSFEWTWYPADNERRHAEKPLIDVTPRLRIGRLELCLRIEVWPGFMYMVLGGVTRTDWVNESDEA